MAEFKKIFVKPAVAGGMVRDPQTFAMLAQDGEWKPDVTYWHRRIRFGDVVEAAAARTSDEKRHKKESQSAAADKPAHSKGKAQ